MAQVRRFLEAHGSSRFEAVTEIPAVKTASQKVADKKALEEAMKAKIPAVGTEPANDPDDDAAYSDGLGRTALRAGFWRTTKGKGGDNIKQFMILPRLENRRVRGPTRLRCGGPAPSAGVPDKGEGANVVRLSRSAGCLPG